MNDDNLADMFEEWIERGGLTGKITHKTKGGNIISLFIDALEFYKEFALDCAAEMGEDPDDIREQHLAERLIDELKELHKE